ncbi:glycosyl hydrolase family 98, partial [Bacteroides sp. OttesenSCG-928-F21]|nr:glycosyl hydrolase family 98 [Bacteroides sp. OttesenSCG-928-F21]
MKKSFLNGLFMSTLLFSFLSVCFYGCKDDDVPQVVVQPPGSSKTINEINANSKTLQKLILAQEEDLKIKSCVALTPSSYSVELSDGNTCTVLTAITALGKGEGVASVPAIGAKKDAGTYYWTIDKDWLKLENTKVPVTQEQASAPLLSIDKEGYWTVECNSKSLKLNSQVEEGSVKSIFSQVDMTNTSRVTFRLSDGSSPITLQMAEKDNPNPPLTGHLRRPISPDQPAWIIHIDTWNTADAQKIIDLIPADIRPYVIFNISLSISHSETTGEFNIVEYGYETAKSWLRTCAENNVWAFIQPASGGFCHFPDYAMLSEMENSVFNEFFRDYPNFLGFNYCEQFWGFDDKFSVTYPQRLQHWTNLMKLTHKYGGYLTISFCGPYWGASLTSIGMYKRDANFAAVCKEYPENLIVCEKFTSNYGFYSIESTCLGAWLSGYAGQYGMRFDQCSWEGKTWNGDEEFPVAAGAIP